MPRNATIVLILLFFFWLPAAAQSQEGGTLRVFEAEELHAGLPPAPGAVNLDTPQAAMESFLFAAEAKDWTNAAYALDLSALQPEEQPERGSLLARQLYRVLQSAVWLDWGDLPDRPDGLEASVSSKDPMAGEPRRSIRIAIIDLEDRPVSIRLSRLQPPRGDPVWVFPAQTVENIPAMYEAFGPTGFEQALPAFLQERAFWTLAWWEVLALPVLLLAALAVGALTHELVGKLKSRQPSAIVGRIIDFIRTPVALMAFVAVFAVVKRYLFTFSGAVNTFLVPLQIVIFVVAVTLIAVRIVDAILDRVVRRNIAELSDEQTAEERSLYTNISAARRVAIAIAVVFGAALVLLQTNVFETLGFSLLASAGVIGLVLAFAARSVLSDVMASLQIALSKTARIGDAVLYDGEWSYVEKINFTHLQLRTWDNRRLMVPVAQFVSNTVENWSKQDPTLLKPVLLRFDHRADVDLLREAFERFVEEDDDIIDKENAAVQVIDQDASGMAVRFYVTASDPVTAWNMHCRLREAMLKTAAELEAKTSPEKATEPAYFPREREVIVGDFSGRKR